MAVAYERLAHLARKMLRRYGNVHRWEETDAVLQNAAMRLCRSLEKSRPEQAVDFFRLAAAAMRSELVDLARHYYGRHGEGANHATLGKAVCREDGFTPSHEAAVADEPGDLMAWVEFHQQIEALPEEDRDVFSLLWYQGLSQAEAAEVLGVSERTIKRRWQATRLRLYDALHGELPPLD